jgi:DNA-binding NarL/FixJ family response regulator
MWILIHPESVPERWQDRIVETALVPLTPVETKELLEERLTPSLDPGDEVLLRLVARGMPVSEVARRLGRPLRNVQRRVAHFRDLFGVSTTGALIAELAASGFGRGTDAPPSGRRSERRHEEP